MSEMKTKLWFNVYAEDAPGGGVVFLFGSIFYKSKDEAEEASLGNSSTYHIEVGE